MTECRASGTNETTRHHGVICSTVATVVRDCGGVGGIKMGDRAEAGGRGRDGLGNPRGNTGPRYFWPLAHSRTILVMYTSSSSKPQARPAYQAPSPRWLGYDGSYF
jgi:hypothetical protein